MTPSSHRIGILFDLDGVLIDSEGLYTDFWQRTESEFPTGIPDFAHVIKGTNLEKILMHFPDGAVREEILRRIHEFDRHLSYPLFDGAHKLLQELRLTDAAIALYTSSNPEKMERLFAVHPVLRPLFDVIVNGSMVTRSKPDPEGYLIAAQALGVTPGRCVVVEDSLQGVRAGLAAGATVAAITGTVPRHELERLTPHVFDSVSQLSPQHLLNLIPS